MSGGRPGAPPPDPRDDTVGVVGRDARADQPGVGVDDLQRLWAPWRFGYVAGDAPVEGCPFCVLPDRGPARDRESLILHRGAHAYVIFNAYPYNPGHLMVVPYRHESRLGALEGPERAELFELAPSASRSSSSGSAPRGSTSG